MLELIQTICAVRIANALSGCSAHWSSSAASLPTATRPSCRSRGLLSPWST